jgi:hypothetical protein
MSLLCIIVCVWILILFWSLILILSGSESSMNEKVWKFLICIKSGLVSDIENSESL